MVRVCLMGRKVLDCEELILQQIIKQVRDATNLETDEFYFLQNGKILYNPPAEDAADVHIQLRLRGGKGGFGSMLRAIGAQIEKTTNREACRDLSGRRLRDINEEKRLKAWLEKQKDREAEAEARKKKKVEKLLHVPKHEFKDAQYEEARSKLTEKVNDAVEEGMKKAIESKSDKPNLKRKAETSSKVKSKKSALWIGADIDSSSATDSDDPDSEAEGSKKSITDKKD